MESTINSFTSYWHPSSQQGWTPQLPEGGQQRPLPFPEARKDKRSRLREHTLCWEKAFLHQFPALALKEVRGAQILQVEAGKPQEVSISWYTKAGLRHSQHCLQICAAQTNARVRSWETQRQPPHSNGSLAQRRPVSPSRGVQTSCPWHFRPHPTSKQAPERRQNQGLGEVTPPLLLTRCVTLAKSPALSKPQRQEGAKREIGGGLGALESGFLNPNFLAAWPWAGCLTCLRPESLTCETGIVTELNSPVCRED